MTYPRRSFSVSNIIRSVFLLVALIGGNLLTPLTVHAAATYYVDATSGSDTNAGTSTSSAWKTIGRVNTFLASTGHVAGDSILFRRGDTFAGSVIPKKSGTSSARITFGAYGMGNKPVISGFAPITSGWTSVGTNLWEIAAPANVTSTSTMVINGQVMPLGRFPKATAANGGYIPMSYSATTGASSTIFSENTGAVAALGNLATAEIVTRPNHWTQVRGVVLSNTGNTITANARFTGNYELSNNLGFFVQNHPGTLTQNGEWAYLAPNTPYNATATGKIRLYYNTTPPTVYISSVNKLIDLTSFDYFTISNLSLEGAKTNAIDGTGAIGIRVEGNDIKYAGQRAVFLSQTSDTTVTGNTITDSQNSGITVTGSGALGNATITNNTILNTGIRMGTIGSVLPPVVSDRNQGAIEISMGSGTNLVQYNTIRNVGNNGIRFGGNNVTMKNNVISNFNTQLDDGGGIYTYGGGNTPTSPSVTQNVNRVISDNIIYSGIGNPHGTTSSGYYSSGIYMDNNTNHVDIINNTIFDMSNKGIPINSPQYIKVHGNTFFNTAESSIGINRLINDGSQMNGGQDPVGNSFKDNIFFGVTAGQQALSIYEHGIKEANPTIPDATKSTASKTTAPNETLATRMRALATVDAAQGLGFDNNIYRTLSPNPVTITARDTTNGPWVNLLDRSVTLWNKLSTHDANAVVVPAKGYKVNGTIANLFTNSTLDTLTGLTASGSTSSLSLDTTGKVTGANSAKITVNTLPSTSQHNFKTYTTWVGLNAPITSTKKYLVRFKTRGTTDNGLVKVSLYRRSGTWAYLTPSQFSSFGTDITQHEFMFTGATPSGTGVNGSVLIELLEASDDTYIDDIEVIDADADIFDPNANVVFEYNETTTPRTVALPAGTYYNIRDARYTTPITGSVTIQPFQSVVLIKPVPTTDAAAPTITLTAPVATSTLAGPVTLTATANDNVGVTRVDFYHGTTMIGTDATMPYSVSWDTTALANGPYVLKAIASDAAGNSTTSSLVSVTVSNVVPDTTAPVVTLTAPIAGTVTGTVTLTATATDTVGVTAVEFYRDTTLISTDTTAPYAASWNVTAVANGTYVLKAVARDAAGNSGTSANVSVTVNNPDTTAPTVSISSPAASSSLTNTVTISAAASDNIAVSKVDFYHGSTLIGTDTTAPYTTSWNTTGVANGSYLLSAAATDTSNNRTTSSSVVVTVANADTTAPVVALTAPTGGSVNGTLALAATASDNIGVTAVEFFYGTTSIGSDATSPYSASLNTTTIANGTYALKAVARDAAGNTTTSNTVTVTVANPDTVPPTVTSFSSSSTGTVNGTVTLTATATDTVGVTAIDFYHGTTLISSDSLSPYSASWNTTNVANGTYVLKAVARDAAGNSGTSALITVTVANTVIVQDTTRPVVTLTAPAAGTTLSGITTLTADASDNVGVTRVELFVGTTRMAIDTTAPYTATWNTLASINGNFRIKAIAYDAAGNSSQSDYIVTVANSTSGIGVAITTPVAGVTVSGTVAVTATVTGSNITKVEFYKDSDAAPFATTASSYTTFLNTTSLTNGTHTLRAIAYNSSGATSVSPIVSIVVSNTVGGGGDTTAGVPGAPTSIVAQSGVQKARVSWSAPASNGGSAITSYTVTAAPGGRVVTSTASPVVFSSLSNGTAYTFSVRANNTNGAGTAGVSNATTPTASFATGSRVVVSVSSNLTVRSSAGGSRIGTVSNNTAGTVLGTSSGWTRVQFPSITGWVSSTYLFSN